MPGTVVEVVGNMHMHTPYSDGEGSHAHIARCAQLAGIDFVIVTDHNVLVQGVEGYYGDEENGYVLVLTGEEVHNQARLPQCNHFLVYGTEMELAQCANDPQELIDAVNTAGGLGFIAHPNDPTLDLFHEEALPWEDWHVERFTGLEIWNFMSNLKGVLNRRRDLPQAVFRPEELIIGPEQATLALWDRLLAEGRRVVGIGNSDAHATVFKAGPLVQTIYPYDFLFNCVNTHVLLSQPLSGDWKDDRDAIYKALRNGNAFIGYDMPGNTRGFRFSAQSQHDSVIMGGSVKLGPGVTLQALAPARSHIKIVREGTVVMDSEGRENVTYTAHEPGAYRVEVWREFKGKERGWIFSNPIYVEGNGLESRKYFAP